MKVLDELDPVSRARFEGEVDLMRGLDHENVVKVLDAGETDGHHWYESEYARLGHLGVMHSYLFFSDLDRVKYFRQICHGVLALHELNPPIIPPRLKAVEHPRLRVLRPRSAHGPEDRRLRHRRDRRRRAAN